MNNAYTLQGNLVAESSLTLDLSTVEALRQGLLLARENLESFARRADFAEKMAVAFGDRCEVETLKTAWSIGSFSIFPVIEIRNATDINGAIGAFAASTK